MHLLGPLRHGDIHGAILLARAAAEFGSRSDRPAACMRFGFPGCCKVYLLVLALYQTLTGLSIGIISPLLLAMTADNNATKAHGKAFGVIQVMKRRNRSP